MNKVITINLGGIAFQLEEGGYDALRAYMETATTQLAGNPDHDEILSDIERAISDKFRALLSSHKNVVEAKEVATVLAEMGPIEADSGEAKEPGAGTASGPGPARAAQPRLSGGAPRRLYRIHDGAMLAGVCNGIGVYLNVDPTFVRIAFALLTIFWGTGLLVYIVLAFVVPEAVSPEEKSAASGIPATAQEFIRRAKEGYYEGMKKFPDHNARREWTRQFKRDMRANTEKWSQNWRAYWGQHAPVHPGLGFALPFLSLLNGALTILFICALISVLATGAVFGRPLPGNFPVWGAALVLLLVYGTLAGPLSMARHVCYRGTRQPGWAWPIVFFLDALIWVAIIGVLVCLAVHYSPEVQSAIHGFPSHMHQAMDDIRKWWYQGK
jgi:phage shock protein PspC (stress-responsive transcriptional regulator)